MNDTVYGLIANAIARTPEWIRRELISDEKAIRARAEEALSAIIADTLQRAESNTSSN